MVVCIFNALNTFLKSNKTKLRSVFETVLKFKIRQDCALGLMKPKVPDKVISRVGSLCTHLLHATLNNGFQKHGTYIRLLGNQADRQTTAPYKAMHDMELNKAKHISNIHMYMACEISCSKH